VIFDIRGWDDIGTSRLLLVTDNRAASISFSVNYVQRSRGQLALAISEDNG
jgi:hypothetical protein